MVEKFDRGGIRGVKAACDLESTGRNPWHTILEAYMRDILFGVLVYAG